MSINDEYVEARIREINDAIQMLKQLTTKDFGELTVYEKFSMRYLIIQLVEAASSICVHILLGVYKEKVEGFPECFIRLGTKGIISENLAEKLSSVARLRNLLVHRYWIIEDKKVYESVKSGLKDFEHFILCIRNLLSKDPVSNKNFEKGRLKFRYYSLSVEEKLRISSFLGEKLKDEDEVVFAYVYGGFVEREIFRDVDVAVWIKNTDKAFYYTVDFSAKLEVEVGFPVDLQVLNQTPLPFKYHVFTDGKLLFSKDEKLRLKIVDETVRKYFDLKMLNLSL